MEQDYNIAKLMACALARDLANGDRVAFGLHAAIGLGAALLAQKLYAPDLEIRHGFRWERGIELSPPAWSAKAEHDGYKKVEYSESHDTLLRWGNPVGSQTFSNVFFIGGMQIDQYGATNLIGIRQEGDPASTGYKVRGPGSIGTPSAAFFCRKYYIFSLRHDARVFVPQVDYVSVPGTDRMRALGYDKRPRLLVTPLGVFDWENEQGRMQIRSLHPGVSEKLVEKKTGFDLIKPAQLVRTDLPSPAELQFLAEMDQTDQFSLLDEKIKRRLG